MRNNAAGVGGCGAAWRGPHACACVCGCVCVCVCSCVLCMYMFGAARKFSEFTTAHTDVRLLHKILGNFSTNNISLYSVSSTKSE